MSLEENGTTTFGRGAGAGGCVTGGDGGGGGSAVKTARTQSCPAAPTTTTTAAEEDAAAADDLKIDEKVRKAMDLVTAHLLSTVREEIDQLTTMVSINTK